MREITLLFLLIHFSYINSIPIDNANDSNVLLVNDTKSDQSNPKTAYGLLTYLAGFKLGHKDIQENSRLNLFAKLFNGILHISYVKYPNHQPIPAHFPYPSDIYPNHLQLPIWYPNIFLPSGNNPVNQQQIINLYDLLNPNKLPHENYQEFNGQNNQQINNNFDAQSPIEVFKPIKEAVNQTESKTRNLCEGDKSCVEAIEVDNFTTEGYGATETTTVSENSTFEGSENNTATQTDNIGNQNTSKPTGYPNSYYHHYDNATAYQYLSITENPLNYQSYNYPKYDLYDFSSNSISQYDHLNQAHRNAFYPMTGPYAGTDYEIYTEGKYNKKLEDSDFIPINKNI